MGDGTRDRVVTGPAAKATGYGVLASLGSVGQILGEAIEEVTRVVQAVAGLVDFWNRAHAAPVPAHVAFARRLWLSDVVPRNKLFAPVLLLDVEWFAKEAYALTKNSAFMDLADTEFAMWTNSSTTILVYPGFGQASDLSPLDVEIRKILLGHESQHVLDFLLNGDRPPLSYHEMAVFETKAYTATLVDLDALATAKPALAGDSGFVETRAAFAFLQKWFAGAAALPAVPETERRIRQGMIDWKDQKGTHSPLLPASAGPDPMNLYLR